MASSIYDFDPQRQTNDRRRQDIMGQGYDEDNLSLDLNEEPLPELKFPDTSIFHPQNQEDRSFISDFPDEFLANDSNRDEMRGGKAPASGIDSFNYNNVGQKRRRVGPGHQQQPVYQTTDYYQANSQLKGRQLNKQKAKLELYEQKLQMNNSVLSGNEQIDFDGNNSVNPTDSSLDSVAAMKRNKNREAALRSRQKKKAEQNQIQASMDKITKENNKLKLDNAALRAENQILKRQLNYFEDLFARKQPMNASHSTTMSSNSHSMSSGSVHNSDQFSGRSNNQNSFFSREDHIQKRHNYPKVVTSTPSHYQAIDQKGVDQDQEEGDISFVLERNVADSPTGGKIGLFSLALIMCICCCSTFFSTHQTTQLVNNQGVDNSYASPVYDANYASHSGSSLSLQEATATESDQVQQANDIPQQAQDSFLQIVLHSIWINLVKVLFLVAFAFCLLLFPQEEIVQWAARKPMLRRIFDFSDVPIAAQTKYIKSDKLV